MAPSNESLMGLRILVAEDELLILLHIENTLHELGCEIVGPVSTVEAALQAVAQNEIDGALLDMNLHGVRITPVAVELVARDIPFILCTGYDRSLRDEAVIFDAPRLTKPFSLESLGTIMSKVFSDVVKI